MSSINPYLLQITPEEYKAAREELRSIDARPIKKVAEAKARKQKRLRVRLDKVGGWGCRGCKGGCRGAGCGAGLWLDTRGSNLLFASVLA